MPPAVLAAGAAGGALAFSEFNKTTPKFTGAQLKTFEDSSGQREADFQLRDTNRQRFDTMGAEAQNRQAAMLDQTQQEQWRQKQMGLASSLEQTMAGEGPSVARSQMQQGRDQAIADARSLAATQRGISPAMAARQAQTAASKINLSTNQQLAQLQAQEQLAARGQALGLSQSARQTDVDIAARNQQAQQQQKAQNDAMTQYYMNQGLTRDQAEQSAKADYQKTQMAGELQAQQQRIGLELGNLGIQQQANAQQQNFLTNAASGVLQGAGGAAGMTASDETEKKEIKNNPEDIDAFLDSIKIEEPKIVEPKKQEPISMLGYTKMTPEQFKTAQKGAFRSADAAVSGMPGSFDAAVSGAGSAVAGLPAAFSGAGASLAAALSDKTTKTKINKMNKQLDSFLNALKSYEFKYKNPEKFDEQPGMHTGIMAQDLEKSKVGKEIVTNMQGGKLGIDVRESIGPLFASVARLNQRINELENKKRG